MRIHVLDQPRRVASPFERATYAVTRGPWFALVLIASRLRQRGIEIVFHEGFSKAALDCDLAIVSSRHHDDWFGVGHDPRARAENVQRLSSVAPIAWVDLRDSSTTTQFEVLPFVQTYAKASFLKDRNLYRRPLYGGRVFTDYYHRVFGVEDDDMSNTVDQEADFTPLDRAHEAKLKLFWNLSYSFSGLFASAAAQAEWLVRARQGAAAPALPRPLRSPEAGRAVDLAAMLRTDIYARNTVAFQRRLALSRLRGAAWGRAQLDPVSAYAYARTLGSTKVAVSCFGNGEICYRENEAWWSGAAVVMPDMSHIETFPALYQDGATYRALAWDLSDLTEVCRELIEDQPSRLALARRGLEARQALFSDAGLTALTEHFLATFCGFAAVARRSADAARLDGPPIAPRAIDRFSI